MERLCSALDAGGDDRREPPVSEQKIKQLIEDPEIRLKAELHSNKEGYQIPEREVLRCFDKITPIQVKAYKESLLERTAKPKISRMGQKTEPAKEQFWKRKMRF